MKCLSVRAPWWLAILRFGKDIENRDWSTRLRGTVYLHASSWFRPREILQDIDSIAHICKVTGQPFFGMLIDYLKAGCGRIVGKVDIVDCVSQSSSPWFFGKFGFVLANPVAFERPIPFKGALGFFDVPDGIEGWETSGAPEGEPPLFVGIDLASGKDRVGRWNA
jgi:hypothetical protein